MRVVVFGFALVIATGCLAQDAPAIKVQGLSSGSYRLTLSARGLSDPAQGQRLLLPTARRLCRAAAPQFGRYAFRSDQLVGGGARGARLTFVQDITCSSSAGPAAARPAVTRPAQGGVRIEDDGAIRAATSRYLRALSSGNYRAAYALTSPEMHGGMSAQAWAEVHRKLLSSAGAGGEARILRLTRYARTPGRSGSSVAVDYSGTAEKPALECGYVVWAGASDGTARIIRHERRVLSKADAGGKSPDQLRALLRCAA